MLATLLTPAEWLGGLLQELQTRRGEQKELRYLEDGRVLLRYHLPWAEVVVDMHDQVKSISSGYASFNYTSAEHREAKGARKSVQMVWGAWPGSYWLYCGLFSLVSEVVGLTWPISLFCRISEHRSGL